MKIMTILGSPRKKGNTAKVLGLFEEMISKNHQVYRLNLASIEVNGCLGCGACQKEPDEPGCVQDDEAIAIFKKMQADHYIELASKLKRYAKAVGCENIVHFTNNDKLAKLLSENGGTADYRFVVFPLR